jgi:glutathione peroxidase
MKKIFLTIFSILVFSTIYSQNSENMSFYNLTAITIDGKEISMSEFTGKKIMIVNVASKCGYTPQYEELQQLYNTYKDKNFIIIGFPSNDFLSQEPGTDEEIKTFCTTNYGVTFQMMSKIAVKGDDIHPIYQWLTDKKQNGAFESKVKWNFQKYLIDENGNLIEVLYSSESPLSEKVTDWIEN